VPGFCCNIAGQDSRAKRIKGQRPPTPNPTPLRGQIIFSCVGFGGRHRAVGAQGPLARSPKYEIDISKMSQLPLICKSPNGQFYIYSQPLTGKWNNHRLVVVNIKTGERLFIGGSAYTANYKTNSRLEIKYYDFDHISKKVITNTKVIWCPFTARRRLFKKTICRVVDEAGCVGNDVAKLIVSYF